MKEKDEGSPPRRNRKRTKQKNPGRIVNKEGNRATQHCTQPPYKLCIAKIYRRSCLLQATCFEGVSAGLSREVIF